MDRGVHEVFRLIRSNGLGPTLLAGARKSKESFFALLGKPARPRAILSGPS